MSSAASTDSQTRSQPLYKRNVVFPSATDRMRLERTKERDEEEEAAAAKIQQAGNVREPEGRVIRAPHLKPLR